jgi:hypothetical protein
MRIPQAEDLTRRREDHDADQDLSVLNIQFMN